MKRFFMAVGIAMCVYSVSMGSNEHHLIPPGGANVLQDTIPNDTTKKDTIKPIPDSSALGISFHW